MNGKIVIAARLLVGLLLLVLGLNGFLHFIPFPPVHGAPAAFVAGLTSAGYFFPFVHLVEITTALLLLSGRFVPLALAIIAPVVINIIAFHVFLAHQGLGPPCVVGALCVFLAWSYRSSFRPMLRATPIKEVHPCNP